ncbi:hypothetical protein BS17DRAFT_790287 [Gyrodon lividus]|nr:hypothetical protein BS17DRAFT_790287 [Gyrodon lividus]
MASTTLYIILTSALFRSNEISYAFSTLLLYDHVICLGEEVEYFWSGPWTLSRILYLGVNMVFGQKSNR